MKQSVEFDFSIGQEVKIIAIGMIGHVQAMLCGRQEKEYQVAYWNESQRYSVWMFAFEIEELKK